MGTEQMRTETEEFSDQMKSFLEFIGEDMMAKGNVTPHEAFRKYGKVILSFSSSYIGHEDIEFLSNVLGNLNKLRLEFRSQIASWHRSYINALGRIQQCREQEKIFKKRKRKF